MAQAKKIRKMPKTPVTRHIGYFCLKRFKFLAILSIFYLLGLPTSPVLAAPGGAIEAVAFYSIAATIVVSFFLVNLALKNIPGIYYAALFAIMLVIVWSLEGGLAAALPTMEIRVLRGLELSFGLFAAGFGYFTALKAIDPNKPVTTVRFVLKVAAAISITCIPIAWIVPSAAAVLANLALMGMFAAHVASTATWRTYTDRPNRSALGVASIVGLAIVIAGVLAVVAYQSGVTPRVMLSELRLFRTIYVAAALSTMAVIITGLIDMRRSRDAALDAALFAARKDAETSAALLQMERDYTQAREQAARGARSLSTASHDIKQPLASMRAELDALQGDEPSASAVDRLGRIVDHLALLTKDMSRTARADSARESVGVDQSWDDFTEDVPAALILETLERMFIGEARAHDVVLRVINSSVTFEASPTAVLRIGANLVTNALQHGHASEILMGVKRSGDRAMLIVADNGRGFEEGLGGSGDVFTSGAKGPSSKGDGLGLSIVKELADENGFTVRLQTIVDRGSFISVCIPIAANE